MNDTSVCRHTINMIDDWIRRKFEGTAVKRKGFLEKKIPQHPVDGRKIYFGK